ERLEDLPVLAVEGGRVAGCDARADLGFEPDVVDECLEPAQHLVAAGTAEGGLEAEVEAGLLGVVRELALALVECSSEARQRLGSALLEGGLQHRRLDGGARGERAVEEVAIEGDAAGQLADGDAVAGVLDVGAGALLRADAAEALQ